MGIKNLIAKAGNKAADKVAKLSVLSPEQLKAVQEKREAYLSEVPSMDDAQAEEYTSRLLAAGSVEVFNEYLNHIQEMYVPIKRNIEYGTDFRPNYNIRYFKITKWVTDKKEKSIEKLVNIYEVLSGDDCNIALVFHRACDKTDVYLAVTNTDNADDNVDVESYRIRLADAVRGNFPGSECKNEHEVGIIPCLDNSLPYSVACASNIPGEKSEKFISQTIEKLLDGIVPDNPKKEYTIVLLATPILDIENRKIHLAELYSGLAPYAGWETNFTYTASDSVNSSATFGVNVGASAGIQQGQNQSTTTTHGETDNTSTTETDGTSQGQTDTKGTSTTDTEGQSTSESTGTSNGESNTKTEAESSAHTEGESSSHSSSEGDSISENILYSVFKKVVGGKYHNTSESSTEGTSSSDTATHSSSAATTNTVTQTLTNTLSQNTSHALSESASQAISNTVSHSIAKTLGKAVSNSVAATSGISKGINLGTNVGANFARSSNVTATVGKNEGITQHFQNYNIKHLLENLELQMKRMELSTALGMWDFAAYVLSEDQNVANNVAYSYLALTQGEKSYVSQTAVNLWRGDLGDQSEDAKEICSYIRELRHPIFALNPLLTEEVPVANVYPAVVTATTSLSGKELAYSLDFPQKSIAGLPVITCAEFGRDVETYDFENNDGRKIRLGNVFHMNHEENAHVDLSLDSFSSHVFITGSTGSGKSNTVYEILSEAKKQGIKFMVVEPAKGEYKNVFGNDEDVSVYGTNPAISELLRINPFSFPAGIHIYEHMDRLVEIFNVCWPMYAAMPAVLKNAIEKSYEDCGWDLMRSKNPFGKELYPNFADVARNIKDIIESSEYDAENKGAYKGSLLTRLNSLCNGINGLVFTENEIPAHKLFDSNTIVDLSRVGSSETKSLLMGMLVLKLQEYRLANATTGNLPLKHITVLEEAHNILKKTSSEQPVEGGNLVGKSVEMISNAIAEMRTYGEGFIIVDQAPGLLDMAAIRNTNTKIIMRLPDKSDRELVGRAANLNDDQIGELAKLPCGVAAVYQNEWIQSVLCKVDRAKQNMSAYQYTEPDEEEKKDDYEERIQVADMLSKGLTLKKEVSPSYILNILKSLHVPSYVKVSILKLMQNPPIEPNMKKFAPIMNALFPEVKESIREAIANQADVSYWTREANNLLLKYQIDDQVRRDIIQGAITYYLLYEKNNISELREWIEIGGLR